jgi:hypothetical protein
MYNLLISLAAGLAVALVLGLGTEFGWAAAIVPGLLAAAIAYFALARRSGKKLEAIFEAMQKEAQAQKLDKAVQTLQSGFALAPWQFLVATQLHSNLGILHYLKSDLDAAPTSRRATRGTGWRAGCSPHSVTGGRTWRPPSPPSRRR